MADSLMIDALLTEMEKIRQVSVLKCMDENQAGIGAVLSSLVRHGGKAAAGEIAADGHLSTPRVAALLQRMEGMGLISRSQGERDKRITEVSITPSGTIEYERRLSKLRELIGKMIDYMGYEKLSVFLSLCGEISAATKALEPDMSEPEKRNGTGEE